MDEKKINFLDIILLIVKNKRFVIIFTMLMSIGAVIYTLVVHEKWTSELVVLPKMDSSSLSMLSGVMGGLNLGAGATLTAVSSKYATIMKSKSVTEDTINKFNLIEYFKIKEKDPLKAMDTAIIKFHGKIFSVLVSLQDNFVQVKATTKDRELSQAITQHYLDFLTDYAQNNTNSSGRQKRELYENRVATLTEELRSVNEEMRAYQAKHNIVHVETQAIATIQSYSQIVDELMLIGLDLRYIERFMTGGTRHTEITTRRDVISETIDKIESNTRETPFVLPLNQLNDHIFVVQDFMVRQLILQKTLETIYPQYELARIEEIEEMDKFEVLEYPTLPGIRSFPSRAVICILVFFSSFLFSSSLVVVKELTTDEDKAKISMIWKTLFR